MMEENKKRKRNANTNKEDYIYYVRSIELLTKMKESKAITQSEYDYLKGCFMRDCQVMNDYALGRKGFESQSEIVA